MRATALVVLAACAAQVPVARVTIEGPPVFEPLAPSLTYAPARDLAHDDAAPAAIFAGLVALAADHAPPGRDARIDAACAELAGMIALGATPSNALVGFALHAHDVIEQPTGLLVARAHDVPAIVAELAPQIGDTFFAGNARVGIGGANPTVVMVVHTQVTIDHLPRTVAVGEAVDLVAHLDGAFHAPHVTITREHGIHEHPKLNVLDPFTFTVPFACETHTGPQWILVEACDAKNVLIRLALFPIACGPAPETFRVEPSSNLAAGDIEHRIAAIINRERAIEKLPPLSLDARAAYAARRQALAMRAARSIDHTLGGTTAESRLRDAGLVAPMLRELTLAANDLGGVSEIILNERAYNNVLHDPAATHVGVAVEADEVHHELYVAIEVVQIIPHIDAGAVDARLVTEILASRPRNEIRVDPRLTHIAQRYADLLALGWTETTLWPAIGKPASLSYAGYSTVGRSLTLLLDPTLVDGAALARDRKFHGFGIGVAQSPRDGALAGRLFVVAYFGRL